MLLEDVIHLLKVVWGNGNGRSGKLGSQVDDVLGGIPGVARIGAPGSVLQAAANHTVLTDLSA